jgi:hypothetical protein
MARMKPRPFKTEGLLALRSFSEACKVLTYKPLPFNGWIFSPSRQKSLKFFYKREQNWIGAPLSLV